MASTTGGDNAKLSSLFNKKKKGAIKSMNANAIAAQASSSASASTVPAAATPLPSAPPTKLKSSAKPLINSPPNKPQPPTKGVADLTLGDKKEQDEKREFQWAKQPKKYKNTSESEAVAKTWEEQEERNRVARRINLQSERAFPTLGADNAQVQLRAMKAPQSKAVVTKNVWSTLNHEDEDED